MRTPGKERLDVGWWDEERKTCHDGVRIDIEALTVSKCGDSDVDTMFVWYIYYGIGLTWKQNYLAVYLVDYKWMFMTSH